MVRLLSAIVAAAAAASVHVFFIFAFSGAMLEIIISLTLIILNYTHTQILKHLFVVVAIVAAAAVVGGVVGLCFSKFPKIEIYHLVAQNVITIIVVRSLFNPILLFSKPYVVNVHSSRTFVCLSHSLSLHQYHTVSRFCFIPFRSVPSF